jgi:hypothetical protein
VGNVKTFTRLESVRIQREMRRRSGFRWVPDTVDASSRLRALIARRARRRRMRAQAEPPKDGYDLPRIIDGKLPYNRCARYFEFGVAPSTVVNYVKAG